ncbi:MAG: hypothetical protein HC936_00565 [Leptolyngbyaceae cyanobacterium SU_3_3]|nr:hypothetical protein [Leptolyngbyaceae cyanobacterium SU_3_3]
MKKVSGLALIAIGLLHSLIALVFPGILGFSGIWPEIVNAGIVDAANAEALRIWGLLLASDARILAHRFGSLCHWIEHQLDLPLPSFVGWGLLAIALFGIVLDIDTGFWLVLVVAVNAMAAGRSETIAASQHAHHSPVSRVHPTQDHP